MSPHSNLTNYVKIFINMQSWFVLYLWVVVFFSWWYMLTKSLFDRKLILQQKSAAGDINLYLRCGSNAEQTASTDDASHYQDLSVSQIENTYQTIDQQWLWLNVILKVGKYDCIADICHTGAWVFILRKQELWNSNSVSILSL